ncbi:iron-containing alcohol dehydrogenase [Pelotalea chapellei]|uniref:Iron-containing alcohol dehydrogenase n=1 Tax=Pelotalea chapellei TaxID=44671 RepID=A0ABS5U3K7_9BACT|nr:iron-containing alcohol dehydrogenase [Pelotalea chapellei]MBT1070245.1 iron-containing alcohol dehydrogenase [Pelotalea chapellei]
MNISKFVAPEIIFGLGSLSQLGESVIRIGASKVFLVSDEGVINAGWVDRAVHYLNAAGLESEIFSSLTTNPKDDEVTEGTMRYRASGCDGIVAVGGGSPTDVAKAIAILATNGGNLQDYEGINKISHPLPPMVIAPSTAGAGSEVSQFTIIVDTARKLKMSIISRSLVPDIAIVDPELVQTMDVKLAAATGLDAFTHGIESYVSLAATPLTDIHALKAIKLVSRYLRRAVTNRHDMEANMNMSMASLTAGLAFSNAILGATHAMTHQVDSLIDQHHGETNASILPHVMEFNLSTCPERFRDIAEAMGEDVSGLTAMAAAERAVMAVRRLISDIGLAKGLRDIGLTEEFIPLLSENALKDACLVTNPRPASREDIADIFRKCL